MMSGSRWKGWGVSEIGPLHIKENIPNQDSFIVKKFRWGIVGVVCDGLGSKKYSHIGSKALTNAIVEVSAIFDFKTSKIEQFELLTKSIWEKEIYPYTKNECSTTLLFVIVKQNKVYIGRVGDGAIGILGKCAQLIEESKDAFTNYTTPFGRDEKIQWHIFNENEIDSITLCSDGISEDIQKDKVLDFFRGYVLKYSVKKHRNRKKDIKRWLKNWPVKGHSDDKTIVALVKAENG